MYLENAELRDDIIEALKLNCWSYQTLTHSEFKIHDCLEQDVFLCGCVVDFKEVKSSMGGKFVSFSFSSMEFFCNMCR